MNKLLSLRPENVKKVLGEASKICILSSHDIFKNILNYDVLIMACNCRIKHVIPGIMRAAKEVNAIVGFELAKSENGLDGGYTGQTPEIYFNTIVEYADRLNFDLPFFIHGDHIKVKSLKEDKLKEIEALVDAQIKAGYTSFLIDGSALPIEENIKVSAEFGKYIKDLKLGLEVEIGEITSAGQKAHITEVSEATYFVESLIKEGINPDLLAINNGSKHGNYAPGEEVFIDLERTKEIFDYVKKYNIGIAQHGITGTPDEIMEKFPFFGIRKGNVGTKWQNVALSGLPEDLLNKMKEWAKENHKDIKYSIKVFKKEIDNIPEKYKKKIEDLAYTEALKLFKIFRSENTADLLKEKIS